MNYDKNFVEKMKAALLQESSKINEALQKKNSELKDFKERYLNAENASNDIDYNVEKVAVRTEELLGYNESQRLKMILFALDQIEKGYISI